MVLFGIQNQFLGIDPEDISTNHLYADGYGVTHWSVKSAINDPRNRNCISMEFW